MKAIPDDWLTKRLKATFLSTSLDLQILDGADMAELGNQSQATYPATYCVVRDIGLLHIPYTGIILSSCCLRCHGRSGRAMDGLRRPDTTVSLECLLQGQTDHLPESRRRKTCQASVRAPLDPPIFGQHRSLNDAVISNCDHVEDTRLSNY